MSKQILVAALLLLIMGGGVAWIALVLVKTMPIVARIYGAASAMKSRTDLLKQADVGRLSESDIESIRAMTVELQRQVKGATAMRLVEHELHLAALAQSAAASGDWEKARTLLAGLRRTWP